MGISKIQGVGYNLRLEVIDEFLSLKPKVPFVEIIVDNWFSPGPHHKKLETIRNHYPVTFHCVGMNLAGADPLDKKYLRRVAELQQIYQPAHVSDHLAVQAHAGRHHHDLLPFPFTQIYLDNAVERISHVQEFLKEPLLIENLSYYVCFESSSIPEVDFINQVVLRSGCHQLLDLNNIWVNQKNLGLSFADYLGQTQWSKVKEIHLAGSEESNDLWIDTHGQPVEDDLLEQVVVHRTLLQGLPIVFEKDCNIISLEDFSSQAVKIQHAVYGKTHG